MATGEGHGDDKIVPLTPYLVPSGGGPHGPDLEARIAKLEASVEHIQSDLAEMRAGLEPGQESHGLY